jgi:hypothetical protein
MSFPSVPGLMRPNEEVTIKLKEPVAPGHQPVVMNITPGAIVVMGFKDDEVQLRNTTAKTIPFLLVVVPSHLVQLGMIPWNQIGDAAKIMLGDILRRLTKKE